MMATTIEKKIPVVTYDSQHQIKLTVRYSNYEQAIESINSINYQVAENLRTGNYNKRFKPYPVNPHLQLLVKAVYMTGKKVVECLSLGCFPDTDICKLFTNFCKISGTTELTFELFCMFVRGSHMFFSKPDDFARQHITGGF